MAEPIANTASGSTSAAASSQCKAHSARPYSPAEAGVNTSRTKRLISARAQYRMTHLEATGKPPRTQFCHARKFRLAAFVRAAETLGFVKQRQTGGFDGPDGPSPTQATGTRLAL